MDQTALHMMEWLAEMGDDVPLADEPIDRFAESEQLKQKAQEKRQQRSDTSTQLRRGNGSNLKDRVAAIRKASAAKPTTKPEITIPDESVVLAAQELAKSATNIAELKSAIEKFDGCNLRINAKNSVFAMGNPDADIMLIDEHPGKQEDEQAQPFAGRSAGLLEKMLSAIGLQLDEVYCASALPWHPPGSRSPTPPEINICKPFLERHIALAAPKLVILMGNTPTRMLLEPTAQALLVRGNWQNQEIDGHAFEMLVTLNPGFLLKQPAQKKLAWQDLLMIKAKIAE